MSKTLEWVKSRTTVNATGCWLWDGALTGKGYGKFYNSGRPRWIRAHRAAWEAVHGKVPDGLMVLHSCDVRRCCNPAHLRTGTNDDNVSDAIQRGRIARGQEKKIAKLTDAKVRSLRAEYASGASVSELSRRYGVSTKTAREAARGIAWKHVQ